MKNIEIVMEIDGTEHTVFGRGDDHQHTDDIVKKVIERIRHHDQSQNGSGELDVISHQQVGDEVLEERTNHSFTFDVTQHTEEPYGDCYYGSRYRPRGHTRARGPVGYSELEET
jgi:hypothetical protein